MVSMALSHEASVVVVVEVKKAHTILLERILLRTQGYVA
jgi:hypothetical protein